MKIEILDFVEGARNARGITVVIDVFRAFSVACYAFQSGAVKIIPAGTVEEARLLGKSLPDTVLIGERHGKPLYGFDLGNSPTAIENADLGGKTVVHTTHAGTQGLVNATQATMLLTGSFVNAKATVNHIRSKSPDTVTLVRMGLKATRRSDEDDLCAEYLTALLTDKAFDTGNIKGVLSGSPFSARFFDPRKPWCPVTDFELCLDVDRFGFAIRAVRGTEGAMYLEKA